MRYRISATATALELALLVGSCHDPTGPLGPRCPSGNADDCWARVGLEGDHVRGIQATRWGLYATVAQRYREPDTGGLFRLDEATGTWEYMDFEGYPVRHLMYVPDPEPRLYLGLDTGDPPLYVSEDGETWRPLPVVAEDGTRQVSAASLGRDALDPDRIYLGGAMYAVWESRDAGETWRWIDRPPGTWSSGRVYFVGRSPHGRIWYGGEHVIPDLTGDLLYSDDGGTWTLVWPHSQDGRRPDAPPILMDIFHHPSDPNTTLVMAPGRLLRTTDCGQTWRDVPHSTLGLQHFLHWNDVVLAVGLHILASYDLGRSWPRSVPSTHVREYSPGEPPRWPVGGATIDSEGRLFLGTSDGVFQFVGVL